MGFFNEDDFSVLYDWSRVVGEEFEPWNNVHKNIDSKLNGRDTETGKKIYSILNLHEWADKEYFKYENKSKLWIFGSQTSRKIIKGYIEKRFYLAPDKKYNAPYIKLEISWVEGFIKVNIHLCDNRSREDKLDAYTVQKWKILGESDLKDNEEDALHKDLKNMYHNVLKIYREKYKDIYTCYKFKIPQELGALNKILYGPPGTGKTFSVKEKVNDILKSWVEDKAKFKQIDNIGELGDGCKFTTFHPAYGYEEFIEGMRPVISGKNKEDNEDNTQQQGTIAYEIKDGVFKSLCRRAEDSPDKPHFMIIDEINRGKIPKIFGELTTLIEDNKRAGEKESISVTLPYSQESFSVPNNVYIIATMNTADKSLVALDTALRRRFRMIEMMPKPSLLKRNNEKTGVNLVSMLTDINQRITDRFKKIGHAFFMKCENEDDVIDTIQYQIIPLLQEYEFDDWKKICEILGISKYYKEKMTEEVKKKKILKDNIKFSNVAKEVIREYLRQR